MGTVSYLHLRPGGELPELVSAEPFKAVVVVEAEVAPDWRDAVSRWLVRGGCRYMLACGPDGSDWDDSVDLAAVIHRLDSGDESDDSYVMTTWHDSLGEAFQFARDAARHPTVALPHLCILHLAEKPAADRTVAQWRHILEAG